MTTNDLRSVFVPEGAVIVDTDTLLDFIVSHGKDDRLDIVRCLLRAAAFPDDVFLKIGADPYLSTAAFGKPWSTIRPRYEGHDVWTLRGTA